MNPRIMKKLCKRVVAMGASTLRVSLQNDNYDTTEDTPRRASRKSSHRERPWLHGEPYTDGRPRLGDMVVLQGTPSYGWCTNSQDGTEYESQLTWPWLRARVLGEIEEKALDWDAFDVNLSPDWPPYKGGRPPKFPRSTPAMIRCMEEYVAVKNEIEHRRREEHRRYWASLRKEASCE